MQHFFVQILGNVDPNCMYFHKGLKDLPYVKHLFFLQRMSPRFQLVTFLLKGGQITEGDGYISSLDMSKGQDQGL